MTDAPVQRSSKSQNGSKRGSRDSRKSSSHKNVSPPEPPPEPPIVHASNKNIQLLEDAFGYVDDLDGRHYIKRFTWRNHNSIQVQVITYGARIISLKVPNRKGVADDIVLGFDDLAGYLYYDKFFFGATIGRVTDKVENATFVVDKKQYWLSENDEKNHANGGFKGFDKAVWIPFVTDTSVSLTHISHDLEEGYPGDLFLQITYQLTPKNEFKVVMEARTSKTTIVNLSNLLYFNLGGHHAGPEEILRHTVSINANCSLLMQDSGLPTGEIQNVLYTRNDFQIPKVMKEKIPTELDDGFDVHFCINRGINSDVSFVARAFHPPSGRILELYSNQCGVRFCTADNFGNGLIDIPQEPSVLSTESKISCGLLEIIEKLHGYVAEILSIDSKTNYSELKDLIYKLKKTNLPPEGVLDPEECLEEELPVPDDFDLLEEGNTEKLVLNPIQTKYLQAMHEMTEKRDSVTSYTEIREILRIILDTATIKDDLEMPSRGSIAGSLTSSGNIKQKDSKESKGSKEKKVTKKESFRFGVKVPSFYTDGRLHGKNDAIYKKQGALCFQSENYPNSTYHKKFPKPILRPGETYNHTIVYKFWVMTGDPNRWIRRTLPKNK